MYDPTLSARFWRKVAQDGDCWLWTAAKDPRSGYGRVRVHGKTAYAHRIAYELMVGNIPDGLHLDHLCRNRACVNPYHLDPVTPLINTQRSPIAHGAKTTCRYGHPYSGDNLLIVNAATGRRRHCKKCQAAAVRRWAARKAAPPVAS